MDGIKSPKKPISPTQTGVSTTLPALRSCEASTNSRKVPPGFLAKRKASRLRIGSPWHTCYFSKFRPLATTRIIEIIVILLAGAEAGIARCPHYHAEIGTRIQSGARIFPVNSVEFV